MNTEPYIRNSNKGTAANRATTELDNKIAEFVSRDIIPNLVSRESIDASELEILKTILYNAVALDVYTQKNLDLISVLSGEKKVMSFKLCSLDMSERLERALSSSKIPSTHMGIINGVNTNSKFAQKCHTEREQKGITKLLEKSVIDTLEKVASHKELKTLLQGSHHIKTVIKLKEYLQRGGNIKNIDMYSDSFIFVKKHVDSLRGQFARNNQYIDFSRGEDGQIYYQRAAGKRKELNGKEDVILQKDYIAACQKEDRFMDIQLIDIYKGKIEKTLQGDENTPSIQEQIGDKFVNLIQRKEFERIAELLVEINGPMYIYNQGGVRNTEKDFKQFLEAMQQYVGMETRHTNVEDYNRVIQKIYIDQVKKQIEDRKRHEANLRMSPREIQRKIDDLDMEWGVPLGFTSLTSTLASAASLSMLALPAALPAIATIGAGATIGALHSLKKKMDLQDEKTYWENVKMISEQNRKISMEKSQHAIQQYEKITSPVRRRNTERMRIDNNQSMNLKANDDLPKDNEVLSTNNTPIRRRRRQQIIQDNQDLDEI